MVQDWPELTKLLTGRHRETGPDRFPSRQGDPVGAPRAALTRRITHRARRAQFLTRPRIETLAVVSSVGERTSVRPVAWRRTQFRQAGLRGRVTKRQGRRRRPVPVGASPQSERPAEGPARASTKSCSRRSRAWSKSRLADNVVKIDKERALIRGLRDLAV